MVRLTAVERRTIEAAARAAGAASASEWMRGLTLRETTRVAGQRVAKAERARALAGGAR